MSERTNLTERVRVDVVTVDKEGVVYSMLPTAIDRPS